MLAPALFGLILLLFAHKLVAFLMGGLAWQRRNIRDQAWACRSGSSPAAASFGSCASSAR